MPWRATLSSRWCEPLSSLAASLSEAQAEKLTEIRIRTGQRIRFVLGEEQLDLGGRMEQNQVDELVSALCGRSRYAYESQIAQGYIPLPGGHRAGVCGRAACEDGGIARMSRIASICIRIARHVEGASKPFRTHMMLGNRLARVLLLGAPGSGKTTALRDAALYLAKSGVHVAVADEREELFPSQTGEALDVLSGVRKAEGMRLLLRSMAPQMLVTDEIGDEEDVRALLEAVRCGVGVLASVHADGLEDVRWRPMLCPLFDQKAFDRYILLQARGRRVRIWDAQGRALAEGEHGKLGCGVAGDVRAERDGVSSGGWREEAPLLGAGDETLPSAPERRHPL